MLDTNAAPMSDVSFAIAATGSLGNLLITVLTDNLTIGSQRVILRFVHPSPDAPTADVVISGRVMLRGGYLP